MIETNPRGMPIIDGARLVHPRAEALRHGALLTHDPRNPAAPWAVQHLDEAFPGSTATLRGYANQARARWAEARTAMAARALTHGPDAEEHRRVEQLAERAQVLDDGATLAERIDRSIG